MPLIQFPHGIDYPDNDQIPLPDIAATLIAHERFLPVVVQLFEELLPGITVEDSSIYVDQLSAGSLHEHFFVAMLIVFQKDFEKEVPAILEHLTGQHIPDSYDTVVTVLFIVALYAVTSLILKRSKAKKADAPSSQIHIDYLAYVNIAAEQLGVTSEKVEAAVSKAIGGRRGPSLARAAVDIFRPAKKGRAGRIQPRNTREISKEAVEEFPNALMMAELDKDTIPIPVPNARLKIRATDRDKADKGWAGKLVSDDVSTKRLPVVLSPTIDQDALAAREEATVDAVLESKFTEDGKTKPYRIHVMQVLD